MKNKIHERVETILWQYSRKENKRLSDRTEKIRDSRGSINSEVMTVDQ